MVVRLQCWDVWGSRLASSLIMSRLTTRITTSLLMNTSATTAWDPNETRTVFGESAVTRLWLCCDGSEWLSWSMFCRNYHVWVEGWMKRPDLSQDSFYDGWQVLDPTPQRGAQVNTSTAHMTDITLVSQTRLKPRLKSKSELV